MKTYGKDRILGGERECVIVARGNRRVIARRRDTSPTDGALWYVEGIGRGYRHLRDLKAKLDNVK